MTTAPKIIHLQASELPAFVKSKSVQPMTDAEAAAVVALYWQAAFPLDRLGVAMACAKVRAKASGAPVYLNISPVSLRRYEIRASAPTGMMSDWTKVTADGRSSRCV